MLKELVAPPASITNVYLDNPVQLLIYYSEHTKNLKIILINVIYLLGVDVCNDQ